MYIVAVVALLAGKPLVRLRRQKKRKSAYERRHEAEGLEDAHGGLKGRGRRRGKGVGEDGEQELMTVL